MDHAHKIDVPLVHLVDVNHAVQFLLPKLDCDSWCVACHHDPTHEHQFVFHLTKNGVDRFAVSFECTPPVDKAIYHGSKAWVLSIIPLHSEGSLREEVVKEIKAGLAALR